MKYCVKCGKEIMDEAVICPGCGCAVEVIREKKIGSKTAGNGMFVSAMIFGILELACCVISAIDDFWILRAGRYTFYVPDFQSFALCFIPLCELLAFTFLAAGGLKKSNGRTSAIAVAGLVCADAALLFFGIRVFLVFLNI